jgi:multisubunit Na+/H+ antiporter MnhG subunit
MSSAVRRKFLQLCPTVFNKVVQKSSTESVSFMRALLSVNLVIALLMSISIAVLAAFMVTIVTAPAPRPEVFSVSAKANIRAPIDCQDELPATQAA